MRGFRQAVVKVALCIISSILFSSMYGTMIPKSVGVVVMVALGFLIVVILILAWAPWIDDEEIHDRVLRERAHIDGTMGWLTQPDGSKVYTLICDYEVHWAPFLFACDFKLGSEPLLQLP
jgi:hypothetical protein